MSGTLTVKELIKELLEFDMDDSVYIESAGSEYVQDQATGIVFLSALVPEKGVVSIIPQYTLKQGGE